MDFPTIERVRTISLVQNDRDRKMQLRTKLAGFVTFALLFQASTNWAAQVPAATQKPAAQNVDNGPRSLANAHLPSYVLGPNDEIVIQSVHAQEIANKPTRISTSGDLNLPMVGRVHAAGMTLDQLETEVSERLKTYIREPDIAINITQFKSQPVSVIGYVGAPGVIQLEGRKTLIEVLSQVGGLKPEAGSRVKIMRTKEWGPIPLPSARMEGDNSVAEVSVRGIETATNPEENIQILPNDVISVPRADIVYVMGEVKKPGGFALNDRGRTISLIEVLARAEGTTPTAALKYAKVIRPVPNSNRIEIPVNLKDLLNGKSKDILLQPDDILLVPNSYAKGAFSRTLDSVVNATTSLIIYRSCC